MQRNICLVLASVMCGFAHGRLHNLLLAREAESDSRDPSWDHDSVQGSKEYDADYVKDSGSTAHPHTPTSGKDCDKGQPTGTHTQAWYKKRCERIQESCTMRKTSVRTAHQNHIDGLEEEYKLQKKILDDLRLDHTDSKKIVDEQKETVTEHKHKVETATKVVKENKHCVEEMKIAKQELSKLEASPKKTPQDIDEECEAKKRVLKLKKCVDEYNVAVHILSETKIDYKSEKEELHSDTRLEGHSSDAVVAQEKIVADAKAEWDAAKVEDSVSSKIQTIEEDCEEDYYDLKAVAEQDIDEAEDEYNRLKKILDTKEDEHHDAKTDVNDQTQTVHKYKTKVESSTRIVKTNKHCVEDHKTATEELATLEAEPNKTPEDIDAECEAKKRVMRLKKCEEEYYEAVEVLEENKVDYTDEKGELHHFEKTAAETRSSVKTQAEKVADAKAAWDAAKARRRFADCDSDSDSDSSESAGSVDRPTREQPTREHQPQHSAETNSAQEEEGAESTESPQEGREEKKSAASSRFITAVGAILVVSVLF